MAFPIDQSVTNPGQVNNAGDSRALFLKKFGGEVLKVFRADNLFLKLTRKRRITSGKSAQFPLVGRGAAKYHTPGQLIQAEKIPTVERTITIDDVAVSPAFIADIDDAMNHYEVRGEYSSTTATELAEIVDRNGFRMIAKAGQVVDSATMTAAGLTPLSGQKYTSPVTFAAAGDELDGQKIYQAIYDARKALKKANINPKDAVCVLPPDQYTALLAVPSVANAVWLNRDVGGKGDVNEGYVPKVGGIAIYESNHVPQADETLGINDPEPLADAAVGSGNEAKYRGNFSKVVGLIFTRDAVGTTELMGMTTKWVDEPLRLGATVLTTHALGHDMLRPECSIPLLKA